jgi:hypothetical protein
MRSRKFIYKTTPENTDYLQEIDCEYHIYGNKHGIRHGFISFPFAKTQQAAEKLLNIPVVISNNRTLDTVESIRKTDNYWEKGEPPKRNRTPVNKDSKDVEMLCKIIMKQHIDVIQMCQAENKRLQESNFELQKTIQSQNAFMVPIQQTIHNDTRDYSKNKKITNIQLFLNTECKDAITIQDFIRNIEISDEDMVCLKEHGYVESVTRLLKRALKDYDVYKRPLHCTDIKREVLHVKDQEGWKKETPKGESPIIDKAFRQISHKHSRKLTEYYKDISVESGKFEEKASVIFKIAHASGSQEETSKKKIIRNIVDKINIE